MLDGPPAFVKAPLTSGVIVKNLGGLALGFGASRFDGELQGGGDDQAVGDVGGVAVYAQAEWVSPALASSSKPIAPRRLYWVDMMTAAQVASRRPTPMFGPAAALTWT